MRTRVKICGITRPEDAQAAAAAGADAIGLVFHPGSPRVVTIGQARAVAQALPPFITVVALFVDPHPHQVREVLDAVPIDLLQFHGDECGADCGRYGRPYIKAISMRPGIDVAGYIQAYPDAAGVLLDAYDPQAAGGTGQAFDWERIPANPGKPVILAGGLNPDNVASAIARAHPYGVDVSTGVEASKGIKDARKIAAFMRGVNSVDRQ